MPVVIALLVAVWAASLLYRLAPVPASVDRQRLGQVMATEAPPALPFWRVLLLPFEALARRLPPSLVGNVGRQLYWAQLEGKWPGWSAVEFWGLRLALMVLGVAVGLTLGKGDVAITLGLLAVAYVWPGARLSGPAGRAMRQVERELPEAAQLLAMLVGTGKPLTEALQTVASGRGLAARWLQRTLANRPPEQPLLAEGRGTAGFLRQEAERSGLAALVNFGVQLDLLKATGTGAEVLLGSLADAVAAEFHGRLMARAETIGDTLVLPTMLFYFLPYVLGLIVPIIGGNLMLAR